MPSNICPTCGVEFEDAIFTAKGDADYCDPEDELEAILARHNALVEAVSPVVEDWMATRPKVVDSEGYVIILCAEQLDALAALIGEEGK